MQEIKNSGANNIEKRKNLHKFLSNYNGVEKLELLHKFYNDLPKQGSSEWCRARKIGASMASSLLGLNKNKSSFEIGMELLNLSEFTPCHATQWGNLMEDIVKKYLPIKIYEFGSVPGFSNCTSCSPDGMFIMNSDFINMFGVDMKLLNEIILLEIKCPYYREPGEIPIQYIPQLQIGMATMYIAKYAAFCDFSIKTSNIWDFNFTNCSNTTSRKSENMPCAIGFIGFIGDMPEYHEHKVTNVDYKPNSANLFCKFGDLYRKLELLYSEMEIMNIFLYIFPDHRYEVCEYFKKYIPAFTGIDFGSKDNLFYRWSDYDIILNYNKYKLYYSVQLTEVKSDWECKKFLEQEINEFYKVPGAIGILPYKILNYKIHIVEKKNYTEEIKTIVKFGKHLENLKNMEKNKQLAELKHFCTIYDNYVNEKFK